MRHSSKALRRCPHCKNYYTVTLGDIHTNACKKCMLYGVKLMSQFKEIIDHPEMVEFWGHIEKWYS